MTGSRLTPIGVVVLNDNGRLDVQTAVSNEQQELVTVGTVSVQLKPGGSGWIRSTRS